MRQNHKPDELKKKKDNDKIELCAGGWVGGRVWDDAGRLQDFAVKVCTSTNVGSELLN